MKVVHPDRMDPAAIYCRDAIVVEPGMYDLGEILNDRMVRFGVVCDASVVCIHVHEVAFIPRRPCWPKDHMSAMMSMAIRAATASPITK